MFMMTVLLLLIALLIGAAAVLFTFVAAPKVEDKVKVWQAEKERAVEKELDNLFSYEKDPEFVVRFYFILPPLFGIAGYLASKLVWVAALSAVVGLFIPTIIMKLRSFNRRKKFNAQILDTIMVLSSSLKGGLSLLQALEVLVGETPVPMSQEIGLLVRENKMGITLEDSLKRLDKRMKNEDLSLVINSILVSRETGGDLTKVLSRLTTTIRDNRKLKESIKTLTLQGRLQGLIMSILPIVFVAWVLKFNRHHFDVMWQSELGRTLLMIAVSLQLIGMFLIYKFSKIRI